MVSVVEVSPFAPIPAKRIADLICALAINNLCEIPFKLLLEIVMGNFPSLLFDFNPIFVNGSNILFIGRDESDWSPTNVALIPLPAKRPNNKRVVVPEFPQFKSIVGSENFPPRTCITFSLSNISMPQCSKHLRVEITSSPFDRFEICDSPFDIAAKIRALCDSDLSPGKVMVPLIDILL